MKKRIIAGMLTVLVLLSLGACSKDKEKPSGEDQADENVTAPSNETKYNFLVLGHDRAANLADVILLVSFDTAEDSLTLMQIPRDTFLDYGGNHYKINSMYSSTYNQTDAEESDNRDLEAARAFATTLEETLCVKIHYATVMDLDGFGAIVDAIGGVDMYVPYDMVYRDTEQGLNINLREGQQTLDGAKAEQFVRYRSGYVQGDVGRGDAQKLFMTAFIQSLKSNLSVGTIGEIVRSVYEHVDTELSISDMIYFGKEVLDLNLSNVNLMTLPGEAKTSQNSGASYYVMNREAAIGVIDQYYNIYDFAVTDDIFDRNLDFCNTTDPEMEAAYQAPAEECTSQMYNGQDITDHSIDIDLLQ